MPLTKRIEVVIENYGQEPSELLKPVFDIVWNACGLPGAPRYKDDRKEPKS